MMVKTQDKGEVASCRTLVNNHIFFQHPDLIRILCVHENVMAVMMNTLGRRAQAVSETQPLEGEVTQAKEKVRPQPHYHIPCHQVSHPASLTLPRPV